MPSNKSLERAAQCWCDEETKGIDMDSRLAVAFAKRLDEPFTITVGQAMEVIRAEIAKDCEPGSYAHGWHCNIAMMCHDAMVEAKVSTESTSSCREVSNDAASRFMNLCFGVETKHKGEDVSDDEWIRQGKIEP